MTFVTAGSYRTKLERLSRLLVVLFPGRTIYQHSRKNPSLPVFILSNTDKLHQDAVNAGANGYFVLPDGEQQLLDAVRAQTYTTH